MKKRDGFTMTEVLVGIGIIGTILVMVLGYSRRSQHRWSIRNISKEITTKLYKVKNKAIQENCVIQVEFTSPTSYRFRVKEGPAWNPLPGAYWKSCDTGEFVTVETPLPNFDINNRGMVVQHATSIIQQQTIKLKSPGDQGFDHVYIKVFPYGGIKVDQKFQ